MDGKAGRPSEWERASQTLYKVWVKLKAFVSDAFIDLNPREERHRFADHMSIRQPPPFRIGK